MARQWSLPALCSLWLTCSSALYCQTPAGDRLIDAGPQVDSLIRVTPLHEQAILISFGFDAIAAVRTMEGIIVIDAGISTYLTSRYRRVIEDVFPDDTFLYLINTHYHPDHYGGNSVFDDAVIVGHASGAVEMQEQWADRLKVIARLTRTVSEYEDVLQKHPPGAEEWEEAFTQAMRYRCALMDAQEQVPVKPPDWVFSDSLSIDAGDLTVEMIHFGPCHSRSDVLIFIPELRLLFTGDLFFRYGRPSITLPPDKDKWARSVRWLERRFGQAGAIVSGHGELLALEDLKAFCTRIDAKCAE